MTLPPYTLKTHLEDINDELATLSWDIKHKYHSAMEHFDLLRYRDKLILKKKELEAQLKATCKQ